MKMNAALLILIGSTGLLSAQAGDLLIPMAQVIADKHSIVYDRNYDDFCMGPEPLGIDLMFYDNKYTHYWACANGLTSFECQGSGCGSSTGGKIIGWVPNALPQANNPAILAFWGDVDYRNGMCNAKRADGNPTTLTSSSGRAAADSAGYDINTVQGCSFHNLYETGDSRVSILDDIVNSQLSSSMGRNQLGEVNKFTAKRVIVQTWYRVGYYSYRSPTYQPVKESLFGVPNPNYYDESGLPRSPTRLDTGNTFQMITAFDDAGHAFTVLNYKEINWLFGSASSNRAAQLGFDAGDRVNFQTIYPDSKTGTAGNQVLESEAYKKFTFAMPTQGNNNGMFAFSIHSAKVCPPGEYYETGTDSNGQSNGKAVGCTGSSCIVPNGGTIDTALGAGTVNNKDHLLLNGPVDGSTPSCDSSLKTLEHGAGCNMKCASGYQAVAGDAITLQCVKGAFVPSQSQCIKMGVDVSASRQTPSQQTGTENPSSCSTSLCERIELLENPSDSRSSLSLSIKLASQPRGTVTITATSSDSNLASTGSALTFTVSNWNIAQTILVSSKITAGPVVSSDFTVSVAASGGSYTVNPTVYYLNYVDQDEGFEASVDDSTKEKGAFTGQRYGVTLAETSSDCQEELLPNSAVSNGHTVKGCKNVDTFLTVKNNFPLTNAETVTVTLTIKDGAIWQGQVSPTSFTFTKDTGNVKYFRVIGVADDVVDAGATFTIDFAIDDAGTMSWSGADKLKFAPSSVTVTNVDDTQNYAGISLFQGAKSGNVDGTALVADSVFDTSRTYRISEGKIQPGDKDQYDPVEIKVKLGYRPAYDVRISITSTDPTRAVVGMTGTENAASQIIEFKGCSSSKTPLQKAIDASECLANGDSWKTAQTVTIYGFDDGKDTSNKECYNTAEGCIDPSYFIRVTAESTADPFMNGTAFVGSSIWSQASIILAQNTAPDQRKLDLKFTTRDSTVWISPEELAAQQAAAEAQKLRDQTALIGAIVGTLLLLIIIVIIVVLLAQKKIKDLKEDRIKDETERAKMGKEADNIDIELTLDEEDEMGFENLDDLTSQLRNVNMKLKREVSRLTEINVALAASAGVAPLSVVSSDDAGTLVEQIRNLKNANDQLKGNDDQKVGRKHKKKEKAQFL